MTRLERFLEHQAQVSLGLLPEKWFNLDFVPRGNLNLLEMHERISKSRSLIIVFRMRHILVLYITVNGDANGRFLGTAAGNVLNAVHLRILVSINNVRNTKRAYVEGTTESNT